VCSTCRQRASSCAYDVEEGQTRSTTLRRQNEDLKRELSDALDVLRYIQHGSDADAQAIFGRLRGGEHPSAILASFSLLDLGGQSTKRASLSSTFADWSLFSPAMVPTPAAGEQPDSQLHGHLVVQASPGQLASSLVTVSGARPATVVAALRLHRGALLQAFTLFSDRRPTLFHTHTEEQLGLLLESVLQDDQELDLATVCEVCGIAAVGCRYGTAEIAPAEEGFFSTVTKQLLDECLEEFPLAAIKTCALAALRQIGEKVTTALAYVGKTTPILCVFGDCSEILHLSKH
jgi:hypothetical protein